MILEQKIGFDKVRDSVKFKCLSRYAAERAQEEEFSSVKEVILQRLLLTDEMRLICMFEDSFPSEGFTDSRDFLIPLTSDNSFISLPSLVLLRTTLNTLRLVVGFLNSIKDGVYPKLKEMSAQVAYYPEISRRIDGILDRYGNVKDNASEALASIRRTIKEKEKSVR